MSSVIIGFVSSRQHAGPSPAISNIPEPSLAERARTLASVSRFGALSTLSQKHPGFPFGSLMPYAIDDTGCPIFFVSTMAIHTQNIKQDAQASLLITQADAQSDPLGASRVTLLGNALPVSPAAVKELYLSRHDNAKFWQDYTDFSFYKLDVSAVYFIGGFGVMGWISANDYKAASPDPLAQAAPGIIEHMNADHANALLLIARQLVDPAIDEALMTSVDRLGFHVRLRTGDRLHGQRIAFPREARTTADTRTILVEMVQHARSAASSSV